MKLLHSLTLGVGLSLFAAANAADNLTPDIIFPDPANGALLYGLSDNGLWGVSSTSPGETGSSEFAGAALYDLSSKNVVAVNLGNKEAFCSAMDVTDDGKTVAGSIRLQPAICRNIDGNWTWITLPIPEKEYEVTNVFTDEKTKYRLTGGEVTNITPDGRYAVGLASCTEYIMFEMACMWDLETLELMELPGLNIENTRQSRFTQISADGRYLLGRGLGGGGYSLYDRETHERKSVGVGLDIYAQAMSPDAHYIAGVSGGSDGADYAAYIDLQTGERTVIDGLVNADAVAWCIANNGVPLIARPYLTPYADAYVWHDGFMFSFEDMLTQVYGMNLRNYGIDNTGKPFQVSADGKTIVMLMGPGQSYVLRLKEDIRDALEKIDLFKNWSVTPPNGAKMTSLGSVTVNFGHNIEFNPTAVSEIKLVDSEGNTIATPLSQGGAQASGSELQIKFRTRTLTPDAEYTVHIPAGAVWISGRERSKNSELNIKYTGRENVPVKPEKISPAEGSSLANLDLNDNPVSIVFDNQIKVNGTFEDRPLAHVYIDEDTESIAAINIDVDLYTGNTMVLYPNNTLYLYKGSDYRIVIPEGAVTDLSGTGGNEEFTITYTGTYSPELGDEKYLFRSTCDDYTNFLFYEGDHRFPVAEYIDMGFDADSTPWCVVRESLESTDMAFGSHSCYLDGGASDDWVATRQVRVPESTKAYLAFDAQSYRRIKEDYLKVYIYAHEGVLNALNSSIVEDIRKNGDLVFNERLYPGASEEMLSGDWQHVTIPLDDYQGKSIYVCFVNNNQNQSMVIIDNIEIVREVKAFLTLRNRSNVVNQDEIDIWGVLSVATEVADYKNLSMTLKDGDGNTVSTIDAGEVNLKYGDTYNFEFQQPLQLKVGVENPYTIEYTLDDDELTYEGSIRDLTFEPVKRVVIEEFTGRDCQFCPGGIVTMEHLVSLYGNRVIPIALHCYNGTDPKGSNVMGYWEFTGMTGAPSGMVNRLGITAPLYYSESLGHYVNTRNDLPETEKPLAYLWKDEVASEFAEPALMEVSLTEATKGLNTLSYTATVKSAITLTDQNIRVFGVLLEDGLEDYQQNAYYASSDPIFGEWGLGGIYGKSVAINPNPVFDNVARSTWGTGYNGTSGLLPSTVESADEYKVEIQVPIPSSVNNVDNCKFVVMLIDENTGHVINAARSGDISGVENIAQDAELSPKVVTSADAVTVESTSEAIVNIYTPSGMLINSGTGTGNFTISLDGYKGIVIVNAANTSGSTSKKLIID